MDAIDTVQNVKYFRNQHQCSHVSKANVAGVWSCSWKTQLIQAGSSQGKADSHYSHQNIPFEIKSRMLRVIWEYQTMFPGKNYVSKCLHLAPCQIPFLYVPTNQCKSWFCTLKTRALWFYECWITGLGAVMVALMQKVSNKSRQGPSWMRKNDKNTPKMCLDCSKTHFRETPSPRWIDFWTRVIMISKRKFQPGCYNEFYITPLSTPPVFMTLLTLTAKNLW